ncbi:leucine-rich repeats and immunoglobulin-like domains protein 3 [Onthophagus taurus]|uniref:leucine-rich repeats and immunoglobulin-like domains protein 3 n=1 Tax=Onthophagus taurus TaxID=166361 RepID=UPI0039BDAD2E
MVGVAYLLFIYFVQLVNCDVCPSICKCLGNLVHCDKKNLTIVPDNIPDWVVELNLNNNNIEQISAENWENLRNLTELKLNRNQIGTLNINSFNNLTKLKVLELNRNSLENIVALSFKSLEQLRTLKLKKNSIGQLRDGAFFGLEKMQTLFLDYNNIEVISKGWLYGLQKLKELSISNNKIRQIESEAWEFCQELTNLDLSNNRLESIKRDTFKDLSSLRKLILNSNNISYIDESAFEHTPRLEVLQLNKNQLSWLIEAGNEFFKTLENLSVVTLTHNNIKSIHRKAFDGLKNVKSIDLSDNNISSIQDGAFKDMQLLNKLKMNTTMLVCDCSLQGFQKWLNHRQLPVDAVCNYPEKLRNFALVNVSVNNLTCGDNPKPRLTEEPDSEIMALNGGNITLSCSAFSSSPNLTFIWKKDNFDLINPSVREKAVIDGNNTEIKSELTIFNVQRSDAGKYQCKVSNSYGTTHSKKALIEVLTRPVFHKVPANVTVQAGSTVRLECAANGEPQPEIAWEKDGGDDFPAARERRMHVMNTDYVFFIINTQPADLGVYSCTARNKAGTIVANATVTIEEKPYFVKPMIDKEVMVGESAVLQCKAGGIPKPSIEWLKDGRPIRVTERHFFTAEDQLMIIVDTSIGDAGTYVCNLNNTLGQDTAYSILSVKQNGITESDKLGIIIITVVCCAVCTSIIWVVIIYQTRRRISVPQPNVLQLEATIVDYSERPTQFNDNISEHSSCKDSGTGDSAKRSNDDLLPESEYPIFIDGTTTNDSKCETMRRASLVYLSPEIRYTTPLLHSDVSYTVSTNHDRSLTNINEVETSKDEAKLE